MAPTTNPLVIQASTARKQTPQMAVLSVRNLFIALSSVLLLLGQLANPIASTVPCAGKDASVCAYWFCVMALVSDPTRRWANRPKSACKKPGREWFSTQPCHRAKCTLTQRTTRWAETHERSESLRFPKLIGGTGLCADRHGKCLRATGSYTRENAVAAHLPCAN